MMSGYTVDETNLTSTHERHKQQQQIHMKRKTLRMIKETSKYFTELIFVFKFKFVISVRVCSAPPLLCCSATPLISLTAFTCCSHLLTISKSQYICGLTPLTLCQIVFALIPDSPAPFSRIAYLVSTRFASDHCFSSLPQ